MYLSPGLLGQDDNFDKLSALWEQLQMCTIETADPALDLMTFAGNAYYFAIIMVEPKIESKKAVPKYTNSKATQTVSGFLVRFSNMRLITVRSQLLVNSGHFNLEFPQHPLRRHPNIPILLHNLQPASRLTGAYHLMMPTNGLYPMMPRIMNPHIMTNGSLQRLTKQLGWSISPSPRVHPFAVHLES